MLTEVNSRQRFCFVLAGISLWLTLGTASAMAQVCTHLDDIGFYSKGTFKVREVRVESPIDFLHAISSQLKVVKSKLPLQTGSVFLLEDFSKGKDQIDDALDDIEKSADPRSRIRVVLARIVNCNETSPPFELEVVYRVYTTNYNSYLAHTWELKNSEIRRPGTTAATTQAIGFLTVVPFLDFNRTRRLHAGGLIRLQLPGIFDNVEISSSGSTNSNVQDFELTGSKVPGESSLNLLEYRLAYTHSDVPAGANQLREGMLRGQVFGATRPLGKRGVVFRFGSTLEGGNQHTDLVTAANNSSSLANSGYGGLKGYVGATLRSNRYSLSGSYALQLGTRGPTSKLEFIKNLGDFAMTGRWIPARENAGSVHRVLSLETRFTVGAIQTRGSVPVTQRFFGGNQEHNFIEGDNWQIRSQPFIRSIPENLLSSAANVGGTRFFSLNVTLAKAIWGKAIIPKEIAEDPDFASALAASKTSARNILVGAYLSRLNAFGKIVADMQPVADDLATLTAMLNTLPAEFPESIPDETREPLEDTRGLVKDSTKIITTMIKDQKNLPSKLKSLLKESNSDTCMEDDSCSQLTALRSSLGDFQKLLLEAGFKDASASAGSVKDSLARKQPELVRELDSIDTSEAVKLADADMKLVSSTLDTFTKELNWIAVSPVGIFDAARVWPDKAGTRYGVGGGLRLSLVNFNVTLGYAFNPKHVAGQPRGAMVFTMDVTDMFR